jgi:hypothetical protein
MLPRFDNFVALDPRVVDEFGIPVLRISMTWGENEKAMIPDMAVAATDASQKPRSLTIMALAVRGCDHLMAEMKRGNI